MSIYTPKHSVTRIDEHREAHYSISGLYDADAAREFMKELSRAVYPFVAAKKRWSVLGNLEGFFPQDRETASVIEEYLKMALDTGMERLAWVNPPSIVLMQHRRLAGEITFEVFEDEAEALHWLRS